MRARWFLARAKDENLSSIERTAAWRMYLAESWYDAVTLRGLPVTLVPIESIGQVRALILERHVGPLSGFQLRP